MAKGDVGKESKEGVVAKGSTSEGKGAWEGSRWRLREERS